MTQIEQIRAEIERRITDNTFGAKLELIDILAWLDTLQEPEVNGVKIKGWMARDGDLGHLRLYPNKPWRGQYDYEWGSGYPCMQILDDNLFPKVTFENSPIEVELLIRKI